MAGPSKMTKEPYTLHLGDCIEVLREMPENSVDAIVTDPPYGLEFMSKEWDGADGFRRSLNKADAGRESVFGRTSRTSPEYRAGHLFQEWCEAWAREALRVLKPGGHLLAFSGSRTYHRMVCAIEDAGFEVRDRVRFECSPETKYGPLWDSLNDEQRGALLELLNDQIGLGSELAWEYGSGFPKSLDVSKAIDKAAGDALAWRAFSEAYAAAVAASPLTHAGIDRSLGIKSSSCYWARADHRGGMPPRQHWEKVRDMLGLSSDFERLYEEAEREIIGHSTNGIAGGTGEHAGQHGAYGFSAEFDITAPATDAARQWQGWGTALKPAHEPICVARKPLVGTVAANVMEFSTGALNIDACRVPLTIEQAQERAISFEAGRWPANIIHDGSDEVLQAFPDAPGQIARASSSSSSSSCDSGGRAGRRGGGHPGHELGALHDAHVVPIAIDISGGGTG